jgi:hypothetical protein
MTSIQQHVEQGTEHIAREQFGDHAVDEWFRTVEGIDPDAMREDSIIDRTRAAFTLASTDIDAARALLRDLRAEAGDDWERVKMVATHSGNFAR